MFWCVLFSIIQYGTEKLKKIAILSIYGYDLRKITKLITVKIVKILFLAGISAYILISIYYVLENSFNFFIELSILYLCLLGFFIIVYTIVVNVFIAFYFQKRSNIKILKGSKPDALIAFFQYAIKIMFVFLLATSLINIVETSNILHEKISNLQTWDKAQNIYTTRVQYTGSDLGLELSKKMEAFYKDMEKHHQGFVLNTDNYSESLLGGYSYEQNKKEGIPVETCPHGKSIMISENYLKFNSIQALGKYSASDMILRDDNVLNILVPQKLKKYENIILEEYLDHFYSQKIEVDNMYNEKLGKELNDTKREDLKINIIYVEDNQTYFTFRGCIVPEQNNLITDPIAKIYTANIHPSFAFAYVTGCFYFYTEELRDPYSAICPLVSDHGLISSIRTVLSVYNQYGKEIQELQQTYRNLIILMVVLLIASIAITYNLVASYYEKNKYKLYIKKIYGYSFLRKNKVIIAVILAINLIPIICMGIFANYNLVLLGILGIILMVVEFISLLIFDFILGRKSFNRIIKGEH